MESNATEAKTKRHAKERSLDNTISPSWLTEKSSTNGKQGMTTTVALLDKDELGLTFFINFIKCAQF